MFKEFRKFILRGNVVDLAVGFVVGAAFTGVVNSLVKNIFTPLIAIFYSGTKIEGLHYKTHDQDILYGQVITSLITFVLVAAVVFFFVVQPVNKLTEKFDLGKEEPDETKMKCPYCLSSIPKKATRCRYCTSKLDDKKD